VGLSGQYGGETLSVEKKSIVRHSNKEYIGHPLIILACCYPTNPPKSTLPKIFDKGFEKKNCFLWYNNCQHASYN
jgi:hypothetical protein